MSKKGWIIISSVFAAAVIGLLAYEIIVQHTVDTHHITRTVIILAALGVTFLRKNSGFSDTRALKKAYRRAYGDLIGSAFEGKPKQERLFYAAIHNLNNNKLNAALDKLEDLQAESETTDERFALTFFSAMCYDDLHRPADAAKLYEKAASIKRSSTALSNAGVCFEDMGDFENAERCFLDAIATEETAIAYNNLAQLYMQQGDFEKALDRAMTAIGLDPKCREALTAAAVAHSMLGYDAEYNDFLRRAVLAGADADIIRQYIKLLRTGSDDK